MKKIQQVVKNFSKSRGYDKQPLEQVFLLLTEEVGELAKCVRKSIGMKTGPHSQDPKAGEEAADVLYMLVDVCNRLDIDMEQEFYKKMKVFKSR